MSDTRDFRKVESGLITETDARQSSDWSKLTACLGITGDDGMNSEIRINHSVPLTGNIRLMLCSDGLTDMVHDDRIEQILSSSRSIVETVQNLMSEALNNGGKDNTTIIAVDIQGKSSLLGRLLHQGGIK